MNTIYPLVSVIIPAYNAAKTICASIDSVFAQSYNNFQIIIIDDGSTDDTGEVISSYGNLVTYLKQDNSGPSSARNRGINVSKGELIAFLDADDVWVPDKLSKQVQKFVENPQLGLCASACNNCDTDLNVLELHDICPTKQSEIRRKIFIQNLFATPTVVVRRECFYRAGIFNVNLGFGEDWDMWLRIVNLYPVVYINEPLCYCRRLETGLTGTFSQKKMADWESIIKCNRNRFAGLYAKTIGYMKAMSCYYFNSAYYYECINDWDAAKNCLIKSIMVWPFNMLKRYRGLIRLFSAFCKKQQKSL